MTRVSGPQHSEEPHYALVAVRGEGKLTKVTKVLFERKREMQVMRLLVLPKVINIPFDLSSQQK